MVNPKHTTSDLLGLDVTYAGQNGVKQHLFCSGSAIVTHVFNTLEEAVDRFGKRIKVEPKHYVQSVNFKQGYASQTYAPRANADRVEKIEYGMGYLKRLIEKSQAAKVAAAPKPVDMRLPHEVFQDKARHEKSRIVAKEGGKPPYTREQLEGAGKPAFKVPPIQTPPPPPESKEEVGDRLAASRAALLSPVIEDTPTNAEIDDDAPEPGPDLAAPIIVNIPKKRGPKPKVQ